MSALKEVLASHLSGDVTDATSEIQKYSHDTSIFEMAPSLVVYPKDTKDVSTLVKEVRRAKESGEDVSVTARAGGTCMSGGPLTRSIVAVFTKYMNKVLEVGDTYAIAQMGCYYRDFEKETLNQHQLTVTKFSIITNPVQDARM